MINKQMSENKDKIDKEQEFKTNNKPNEIGGFYFSSSVKIFDPNSKEIIVHKRGDYWCL